MSKLHAARTLFTIAAGVVAIPPCALSETGYAIVGGDNIESARSAASESANFDTFVNAVSSQCGDANGDGLVKASDAQLALRASVGTFSCALAACDASGDGKVTTADALRILRYAVGHNVTLNCPGASTTTMTWKVSDGCPDGNGLYVRLFDVDNDLVYPNSSEAYTVGAGNTVNIPITCEIGSKICYGATDDDSQTMYWGVGLDGNFSCESCCATCANTTISVNPVCGVVEWTLSDGCDDGRGIQYRLFDVDNDLVSPGGNQAWIIESFGGQSAVPLACINGAKICYGAEQRPPNGLYWGVGIDGVEGCANCCLTCPGSGIAKAAHNLVCE